MGSRGAEGRCHLLTTKFGTQFATSGSVAWLYIELHQNPNLAFDFHHCCIQEVQHAVLINYHYAPINILGRRNKLEFVCLYAGLCHERAAK